MQIALAKVSVIILVELVKCVRRSLQHSFYFRPRNIYKSNESVTVFIYIPVMSSIYVMLLWKLEILIYIREINAQVYSSASDTLESFQLWIVQLTNDSLLFTLLIRL